MSAGAERLLEIAAQARRDERPEDGRRPLLEAVALCRQASDQRLLIRALKAFGQLERDVGDVDAALERYEEAAALCLELGDDLARSHTVRHVGDIHREASRPDRAMACYDEALAILRKRPDASPLDLANLLRPMAIVTSEAGDAAAARGLWTETRALYASLDIQAGVDECDAALARLGDGDA